VLHRAYLTPFGGLLDIALQKVHAPHLTETVGTRRHCRPSAVVYFREFLHPINKAGAAGRVENAFTCEQRT
jgi:hypothetical protein